MSLFSWFSKEEHEIESEIKKVISGPILAETMSVADKVIKYAENPAVIEAIVGVGLTQGEASLILGVVVKYAGVVQAIVKKIEELEVAANLKATS